MSRRTVVTAGAAALLPPSLCAALPAFGALPALEAMGALLPGVRIRPDHEAMVPVPGGRVYVRSNGDLGGARPPIVMLHGGPGSAHWYFLNATVMAAERAVILYDQLDSGRSDTPDDPANWTVPRFVAELEAVRAHLGVKRWHVLGASWGGTVALEYAAQRPVALAGLVLQSPLIWTKIWLEDARILKDAMPAAVREQLDRCDVPGAAPIAACNAATAAFNARYVRRLATPAPIAAYKAALPRSFSDAIYNHMWGRAEFTATGTLKDYDGRGLLTQLDAKRSLFVAGAHDEARPETVRGFAQSVPGGAAFRQIAGAAHSVMNDAPAAYVALLRTWLAEQD
jgi:proline iminopeptidase/L-proline amide hydrolase